MPKNTTLTKLAALMHLAANNRRILAGLAFAALFLVMEAEIHVAMLHHHDTIPEELLTADLHEGLLRLFIISMFVSFAVYMQRMERKRAAMDRELVNAGLEWERTFDAIPDFIALIDTDYRILRVNRAMARRLGVEPEQIVGTLCYQGIHGTDQPPSFCPHRQLLTDQQEHTAEIYEERIGGYFEVTVSPLRDREGRLTGCTHMARDISERKRAEADIKGLNNDLEKRVVARTAELATVNAELEQEIADRLKADATLRASEEQYRTLFEQASDGIFIGDADGNYEDVNLSGCRMLGYSREQLLRLNIRDLVAPQDLQTAPLRLDEMRFGKSVLARRRLVCNDGSLLPVEISGSMLPDGRFLGFVRDITERKKAEEALVRSEEKFRTLFEESFDGLFITSPGGRILDMNKKGIAMFGYDTKEEILSLDLAKDVYVNPLERQRILDLVSAQSTAEYEVAVRKKSGETLVAQCSLTAARDERGAITSYRGIIRDITERKRTEDALKESEKRYRRIADAITDYIYTVQVLDGQATETRHGPGCEAITGYTVEAFAADPFLWINMVAAEDRNAVEDQTKRVLAGDEAPVIEHRVIRKDGQPRWVRNTIVQRRDPQGRLRSYDGLVQDITERKQSEEMLRNYASRLQILSARLMKAREDERRFIAHELHDEIGQLLTGAKLSLDKTRRGADAETAAELSLVQEELNVLMVRVRDLSLNLRPALLDTLGLLPALQWHFKRYTEQTGVKVDFSHNVDARRLPLELETVIYRVVQEALTNVARHAAVEAVNVSLLIAEQAVNVTIEDKGDGFDAHATLESGRTMGLTGMSARVDDLGGAMSIRSTQGSGTTLTVSLPLLCMLPADEKRENA